MISCRELVLLLNGVDHLDQTEAIESLVRQGLSAFVINRDAITGLTATPEGLRRLNAMTLPRASE